MICVTLVQCVAPRQVEERKILLPEGTVLSQALQVLDPDVAGRGYDANLACGVWGRVMPLDTLLREGDRVELYRPLVVDPKVARRERFARQGARATGLFASRRPGAKAGY
ncbi:RnfH family protein [Acidovorax sp. DW039]|uniref:RnfH family protein n=1 Tax=Acidovorax sp. DW039 TaxID=3095606 RepID=UPI0030CE7E02